MKKIIYYLICQCCLVITNNSRAADFNINIPVELANMPTTITAVVVKCHILCFVGNSNIYSGLSDEEKWNLQSGTGGTGINVIGTGQQVRSINPSTGYFNENISIGIDTAPGFYPNNAHSAYCRFKLRDTNGTENFPSRAGTSINEFSTYQAAQAQGFIYTGYVVEQNYGTLQGTHTFNNPANVGQSCTDADPTYGNEF